MQGNISYIKTVKTKIDKSQKDSTNNNKQISSKFGKRIIKQNWERHDKRSFDFS